MVLGATFVLSMLLATSCVQAAPVSAAATDQPLAFILLGDSTTNPGAGWGNGFCSSLADVPLEYCSNLAVSGATTGTCFESGTFDTGLETIKEFVAAQRRPLVTIQFGHNDQKIAPPESMGQNLTIMVDAIREAGGEPILVTSLTRRIFYSNGTINDLLLDWANETQRVAAEKETLLIDLHRKSIDYCEAIGPDASHQLNLAASDNTHLNAEGIVVFGRMTSLLVREVVPEVVLTENDTLDYNIEHGIPSY